jgi:hypothetical protein
MPDPHIDSQRVPRSRYKIEIYLYLLNINRQVVAIQEINSSLNRANELGSDYEYVIYSRPSIGNYLCYTFAESASFKNIHSISMTCHVNFVLVCLTGLADALTLCRPLKRLLFVS